jgi:S-adenosyl-L-methionine hydrolase (adenosine-forming)
MGANRIITMTSDFGLKDPYVAEMKAVILRVTPRTTIIDITHEITKFDIREGAFTLFSATPYFPKKTIHIAIVDPGVGSKRRAILIQTKQGFFVGPDNGLLILAAEKQGIEHIYLISNSKFMLSEVSNTFHGRDIFAPAAAHLKKGAKPSEFGPEVTDPIKPNFLRVKRQNDSLFGEILHIDSFGNIITNIEEKEITQDETRTVSVELTNNFLKIRLGKNFSEVKPQEPIALIGSHGFLEVALNQASAAEKYHTKAGDKIVVALI